MTNRPISTIFKTREPIQLRSEDSVRRACAVMAERGVGSVLVVDEADGLVGIFTGRDAVRLLAQADKAGDRPLAEAMTKDPVTLSPQSRAIDALCAMANGGFRHMPVTEHGRVIGLVSRGDFKGMEFEAFTCAKTGRPLSATGERYVGEIIAGRPPLSLGSDDTVARACQDMAARGSGSTLVTDAMGRLIGIFTGCDAVRVLARDGDAAGVRLEEAMTSKPTTACPDCGAIEALRTMSDGGFRHLPVVENGRAVGLVSRGDFNGPELDRLDEEEHLKEVLW